MMCLANSQAKDIQVMNSSHQQHGFVSKGRQHCCKCRMLCANANAFCTIKMYTRATMTPSGCSYVQWSCEHQPGSNKTPDRTGTTINSDNDTDNDYRYAFQLMLS